MTERPRVENSGGRPAEDLTDVVRLPGFWFACAAIFLVNGLIALVAGFVSLGAIEVVTALFAAGAAIGILRMRRPGGTEGAPRAQRADPEVREQSG
jgi:hypothetical protein